MKDILKPEYIYILLAVMGVSLVLALLLLLYVVRSIRKIRIPEGADTLTALRATPFAVVLLLDLLDLSLDFLSAPIAWTILNYLGLKQLRGVTIAESLIPGTQFIPTMTLAWIFARLVRDPGRLRSG